MWEWDFEFVIFCFIFYYMLHIVIICYATICNNQDDLDQETFETPAVDIPPPYLHLVDFTHCRGQSFSNSDLPPSYENCVLESQPPSYSPV